MRVTIFTVCFCIVALGINQTIQGQDQIAKASVSNPTGGSREQDRLSGNVRRVRVETVALLVKEGKPMEGPRVVREISTYDQNGQKVDFVSYHTDNGAVAGNREYLKDTMGNSIEMVLRGDDGSILKKEKYDYQFDEFGNWKKMTASIAVYENGSVGYEPFEIIYRIITYYYNQPAPKVTAAPSATVPPVSNTNTKAAANVPRKVTKPSTEGVRGVAKEAAVTGAPGPTVQPVSNTNTTAAANVPPKATKPSTEGVRGVAKEAAVTRAPAPTVQPVSNTSTTAAANVPSKVTKPTIEAVRDVAKETSKGTEDSTKAVDGDAMKSEKIESPAAVLSAAPIKSDVPKLPVIQVSEATLRKAAIRLPEPQYPEAARLLRAEGNAEVHVLVDEKGDVVRAVTVSGNPLFSEVAAAAARKAKFSPIELSPDPARIHGVINYTFKPSVNQPAAPALNAASNQLKTSQSGPAVSDLKIIQPGELSELNTKAAAESPVQPPSLYDQGLEHLALGRLSEAAAVFRQATDRNPNDAAAYAKLGIAYAALRQNQEAVVVLKMAIKINPAVVDAEAYYHLSNAYTAQRKFPNALEAIKQAMYIARAEQANPELANAFRFPSLADLHYSTGLTYYNLRRYSAAIDELKQATTLNPKLAQAHYGLALSYLANGERKSAEKQRTVLEGLDPVYAAKIAKLLVPNFNDRQGFGFVLSTSP